MSTSRFLLASALALGLGASAPAQAFQAQGYVWDTTAPVTYQLQPEGSDDVTDGSDLTAIRNAFNTWEEVACSALRFTEATWAPPRTVANDGGHRIMWVEEQAEWPGQAGTLALTYTFYTSTGDRKIVDADMVVNGVNWTWTTVDAQIGQGTPAKVDIETVVFHEAGHFLGLDHSSDESAAMYPSNNKLKQRGPATDDVRGVCSLYPNGQPVPGEESGAAVGSPCTDGSDCLSSLCLEDQLLSRSYCTGQCNPAQQDCPAGYVCEDTEAYGGLCFAPTAVDELCDLCGSASQCASGLCVNVPNVNLNRPFCSRACDPTPGQPQQCPNGFQCVGTQQGTSFIGACVPNSGVCDPIGKGGQNEACYANGSCKPGFRCVEYYQGSNLGLNYCYADCGTAGAGCGLERTVCTPLNGINANACLTVAREGQPCIPEVCESTAFCAWDDVAGLDSALCYRMCFNGQADCPANHQCLAYDGIPPLCVPNEGFKPDGDGCSADAECVSGVCRTVGSLQLCTRACATTNPDDCVPGLRCLAGAGSDQGLCWPEQYTDPRSADPSRGGGLTEGYCACDTTSKCDKDCDCDPECEGSCTCVATGEGPEGVFAGALLLLALGWARRRR
ncbi:MAG: matrixin family metalloprotease [Deltaproteobacteria bacterium]|nr:matrixin family metalloprotease [Deltaproteobacteria bacterium]